MTRNQKIAAALSSLWGCIAIYLGFCVEHGARGLPVGEQWAFNFFGCVLMLAGLLAAVGIPFIISLDSRYQR